MLLQVGQVRPGLELLAQVLAHPASDRQTKASVQQLRTAYKIESLPRPEPDRPVDLAATVSAVQATLAMPVEEAPGRGGQDHHKSNKVYLAKGR